MSNLQQIEAARATYDRALAALKRNGAPIFSPDETKRRKAAARADYDQALAQVKAAAARRLEAARASLPTDNPYAALVGDALPRAAALASFVREDIAASDDRGKLDLLKQAAASGDVAYLWAARRYVGAAWEPEGPATDAEFRQLWAETGAQLDPDAHQARQAVQAEIIAAQNEYNLAHSQTTAYANELADAYNIDPALVG